MTGWRLGYGIIPKHVVKTMHLLLAHAVGYTSHFTQYAGIGALLSAEAAVKAMLKEYSLRRDVLTEGLESIPGIRCRLPPRHCLWRLRRGKLKNFLLQFCREYPGGTEKNKRICNFVHVTFVKTVT